MRFFNTAGPVEPADHYCIPPLQRFDLDEVLSLVLADKLRGRRRRRPGHASTSFSKPP